MAQSLQQLEAKETIKLTFVNISKYDYDMVTHKT